MRNLIFILILVLICPSLAWGETNICGGENQQMNPKGYQQLAVSTVSVGLTLPAGPIRKAVIAVEANPIRWRDDGVAPTASVGTLVWGSATAAPVIVVCGPAVGSFRAIRQGAADASLSVNFYGD